MFDINILKKLFIKKTLLEYFMLTVIILTAITIVNAVTIFNMYDTSVNKYDKRLEVIDRLNGDDLSLLCSTVTCTSILNKDTYETYYNSNNILRRSTTLDRDIFDVKYLGIFNKNYDTILKFKNIVMVIDDKDYFNSVNIIMIVNYVFIFLFFTIPFFIFKYEKVKLSIIEDRVSSEELEISLQRDLAESLNHELTLPIVIIRSITTELYTDLIKSRFCTTKWIRKEAVIDENKLDELYASSILSIETIEEVLRTITATKDINNTTRDTTIYEILRTTEAGVNSLSVDNININISKGKDIAKRYRPCRDLGNGKLSRIFKNHILNSKEAKAKTISIIIKLLDENTIELILVDNGMGIRNNKNEIRNNPNEIFEHGITTKRPNGDIASNVIECSKSRGIGMYINKRELDNVGGSVTILRTSKQGTIFRLVFPVYKMGIKKKGKDEYV